MVKGYFFPQLSKYAIIFYLIYILNLQECVKKFYHYVYILVSAYF